MSPSYEGVGQAHHTKPRNEALAKSRGFVISDLARLVDVAKALNQAPKAGSYPIEKTKRVAL
jgi:hypothetical protein